MRKWKWALLAVSLLGLLICSCTSKDYEPGINPISTKAFNLDSVQSFAQKEVFFGDVHIHTGWSFDAFTREVRATPDDAYRFAKGQAIDHVSGDKIQIKRPLDFMAVSDHAEYMGMLMSMMDPDHPVSEIDMAQNVANPDRDIVKKALRRIQFTVATNWPFDDMIQPKYLQQIWKKVVETADRHYEPGKFTTFPAYEWTSSPAVYSSLISGPTYASNLHRNVIFKGGKVSGMPFSSFHSQNPEDLWKWMDQQRDLGIELLAIPHNANISGGLMYKKTTFEDQPMDLDYIQTRMKNEPINEVVQIKGQSMTHPILSPNDEFADFEIYKHMLGNRDPRKVGEPEGSYVRQALRTGLEINQKLEANPFQFGFIGSSDGHNGATNVEEDNNIGKAGVSDMTPEVRVKDTPNGERNRQSSVGGLAAVWAEENTREAIYEAMQRKEVYATSGPRIQVRFFGGWGLDSLSLEDESWIQEAYKGGVPMGGEMSPKGTNQSPAFVIHALKDAEGANLDRIQVIKGWIDDDGKSFEKIYDVAWSDNRQLDAEGKLSAVGNTVNVASAAYTNDIGAVSLSTVWNDPDFDADQASFYYLRVLEIPTPRWTTFDAVVTGTELTKDAYPTIQERAWSSPIWYYPNANQ